MSYDRSFEAVDRARHQRRDALKRRRFVIVALTGFGALAVIAFVAALIANPLRGGPAPTTTPVTGLPDAGIHVAQLSPGQCFASFESAWAPRFALADCAGPHAAQLVAVIPVPGAADAVALPAESVLRAEAQLVCQSPDAIDAARAAAYGDIVVDVAYPVTQAEWDAGHRSYLCFATRSSGEPLEGSVSAVG